MPKIKYMDVIYNSYRMRKLCPNNNYKNKGVIPKTTNTSFPLFTLRFPSEHMPGANYSLRGMWFEVLFAY